MFIKKVVFSEHSISEKRKICPRCDGNHLKFLTKSELYFCNKFFKFPIKEVSVEFIGKKNLGDSTEGKTPTTYIGSNPQHCQDYF